MSNSRFRLDSVSPALSRQFFDASELQRRRAAYRLALAAVAQTGLREDTIDAVIAAYSGGRHENIQLHHDLKKLSEKLDEQYFALSEDSNVGKQGEALIAFRRARAVTALLLALYSESEELHESIYEAIIALQDRADAVRSAEMALHEG